MLKAFKALFQYLVLLAKPFVPPLIFFVTARISFLSATAFNPLINQYHIPLLTAPLGFSKSFGSSTTSPLQYFEFV